MEPFTKIEVHSSVLWAEAKRGVLLRIDTMARHYMVKISDEGRELIVLLPIDGTVLVRIPESKEKT